MMHLSLRGKIVTATVLSLFVGLSIVSFFTIFKVRAIYAGTLEQRAETAAQELTGKLSSLTGLGLYLDELSGFDRLCQEVAEKYPGIDALFVTDPRGKILYRGYTASAEMSGPLTSSALSKQVAGSDYGLLRFPFGDNRPGVHGLVLVVTDLEMLDQQVAAFWYQFFLVAFSVSLVALVVLLGLLRTGIAQPTIRLMRWMDEVEKDLHARLPFDDPSRNDEIGRVAQKFDRLVRKLLGARHSLEQANRELEQHVDSQEEVIRKRTAELERLNRELQTDNERRKELQKQLAQMARFDSLTGVPNRAYFMEILPVRLEHSRRHGHKLALFLMDLDRFKEVNDRFGHAEGDYVLKVISKKIKNSLRTGDFFARLGGDEFVLIVEEYAQVEDLTRLAEKLREIVMQPVNHGEACYALDLSVGIALDDSDSEGVDALLDSADRAMYEAKRAGIPWAIAGSLRPAHGEDPNLPLKGFDR